MKVSCHTDDQTGGHDGTGFRVSAETFIGLLQRGKKNLSICIDYKKSELDRIVAKYNH